MNPEPCGRQIRKFFLSGWRNKIEPSSLPWNNSRDGCRGLHGAFSVTSVSLRSPEYYSESGYNWESGKGSWTSSWSISVDGQIRFEYATCRCKYFSIRKEKVADTKISGYVRTLLLVSLPWLPGDFFSKVQDNAARDEDWSLPSSRVAFSWTLEKNIQWHPLGYRSTQKLAQFSKSPLQKQFSKVSFKSLSVLGCFSVETD